MNKDQVPKAFGVFKPTGHVVSSFPSDEIAKRAAAAFVEGGFTPDDVHLALSKDVVENAQRDIASSGLLASIGQELNLVKEHLELAKRGHGFVVVRARDEVAANQIGEIAKRFGADRAQRYGHFVIEELIEPGTGEQQVAESPDRGLDAQTVSGREGDHTS